MEVLFWALKWTVGPVLGVIITLAVREPLRERVAPLVTMLGSKKEEGVSGRWVATFFYGPNEIPYVEVIEVSLLLGAVVGRIVPNALNHADAKKVERMRPLRIRGTVKDNRFFTGVWLHPNRLSHHHGAFDLIIDQDNEHMNGIWLGYSESKNIIESGRWTWQRLNR